jgi:glycosyltransferase involved in cell wall biosynthesis
MPDIAKKKLPPVTIAGVYIKSDAYPNVKYKVEGLLASNKLRSREINFPPQHLQRIGRSRNRVLGLLSSLWSAVYFGYAHLRCIVALTFVRDKGSAYIPYPSVFIVYFISLLPKRWRPARLCVDVFISIYDTVVEDRKLLAPKNMLARLLFAVEKRAYQYTDLIFVDTALNAEHLCSVFDLPADKVMPLSLSINEAIYASQPYLPVSERCNVLFIGTFVPLQGVTVIAQAFALLQDHPYIHLHLIGDGQTASEVASVLASAGCKNFSWERGWQNAQALAQAIAASDICLGIFGNTEKAQRVWPLKNYAYMAMGRAIITADTKAARDMLATEKSEAFVTVAAAQPEELARAIVELANDPAHRLQLAQAARHYYEKNLSNTASLEQLVSQLLRR